MTKKDDYKYSEDSLYSMACRLRAGLRDAAEENKDDKAAHKYMIGSYAEEIYTCDDPDIRVRLMTKAWKYAILLDEVKDMPKVVRDAVKEEVKKFVDSYDTLFQLKKEGVNE